MVRFVRRRTALQRNVVGPAPWGRGAGQPRATPSCCRGAQVCQMRIEVVPALIHALGRQIIVKSLAMANELNDLHMIRIRLADRRKRPEMRRIHRV